MPSEDPVTIATRSWKRGGPAKDGDGMRDCIQYTTGRLSSPIFRVDSGPVSLERLVRRDRAVAGVGLLGLTGLAWLYLLHMATMAPASMAMPMPHAWSPAELVLTFLMWSVMMIAMMIPAATPMILTFATINRRRAESGGSAVPTAVFLAGYLVIWSAFSLLATLGQWALQHAAVLAPASLTVTPMVGGLLLVLAGVYQLT